MDLGHRYFGLTEWGVEERKDVKDLVTDVLARAGRPLTWGQIRRQMRGLRLVSQSSVSMAVRSAPGLCQYGCGLYGLRSWGDSIKLSIVADGELVAKIIKRSPPLLVFKDLCKTVGVSSTGKLAEALWQTCSAHPDILCIPEKQSDDTHISHAIKRPIHHQIRDPARKNDLDESSRSTMCSPTIMKTQQSRIRTRMR